MQKSIVSLLTNDPNLDRHEPRKVTPSEDDEAFIDSCHDLRELAEANKGPGDVEYDQIHEVLSDIVSKVPRLASIVDIRSRICFDFMSSSSFSACRSALIALTSCGVNTDAGFRIRSMSFEERTR